MNIAFYIVQLLFTWLPEDTKCNAYLSPYYYTVIILLDQLDVYGDGLLSIMWLQESRSYQAVSYTHLDVYKRQV